MRWSDGHSRRLIAGVTDSLLPLLYEHTWAPVLLVSHALPLSAINTRISSCLPFSPLCDQTLQVGPEGARQKRGQVQSISKAELSLNSQLDSFTILLVMGSMSTAWILANLVALGAVIVDLADFVMWAQAVLV